MRSPNLKAVREQAERSIKLPSGTSEWLLANAVLYLLSQAESVMPKGGALLEHGRNCPANAPSYYDGNDCTCGLKWRIELQTEREMHNAWRKRAEEAEAALAAQTSPAVGEGSEEIDELLEWKMAAGVIFTGETPRDVIERIKRTAAKHPQPAPERDDYNEPFILAKQRVAIVERIMKLGYIKQTRDTEEGQIRFVARDDVISAIHNVAKVSRAKDCGPHPDDNKKVAGPAPEGERET